MYILKHLDARRIPEHQLRSSPGFGRTQERDLLLTKHCILTPFNMASTTTPIITMSQFIKDKGGVISDEDMKRITHDLRSALTFLGPAATSDVSLTKDRIAVQLV